MRTIRATWRVACLFLLLFIQFACRPKTANVRDDLLQYIDKARLWETTEAQISKAITSVRQDQFVHDDFINATIKPVIGVSQNYVQELERYQPHSPPLVNVHQEYIEAWRAHYLALAAMVDAVEKKDYIRLAKANTDLLEAQRSVSDARADLARLFREAGLQKEAPGESAPSPPAEDSTVSPSSPS